MCLSWTVILTFVKVNGYVNASSTCICTQEYRHKSCSVIKQILQLIFHHLRATLRFVVFSFWVTLWHTVVDPKLTCLYHVTSVSCYIQRFSALRNRLKTPFRIIQLYSACPYCLTKMKIVRKYFFLGLCAIVSSGCLDVVYLCRVWLFLSSFPWYFKSTFSV